MQVALSFALRSQYGGSDVYPPYRGVVRMAAKVL